MKDIDEIKSTVKDFLENIFTTKLSILILICLMLGGYFNESEFISIITIIVGAVCVLRLFFTPFLNKRTGVKFTFKQKKS